MLFFFHLSHRKHITTISPDQIFMVRLIPPLFVGILQQLQNSSKYRKSPPPFRPAYLVRGSGFSAINSHSNISPAQIFPFYILNEDDDFPPRLHDLYELNDKKYINKIIVVFISSNLNKEVYLDASKIILLKRKENRHFRAKYCRHTN